MKERILVKYHYQNDRNDTTINCFSMLRDSEKPLKIIDVISEFPGLRVREYGTQGYHFRFFDKLGKLHCWVDIKNLNVQAPVIKNTIEVKVLLLPNQADSVIFANLESSVAKYEERLAQQKERPNPQSGGFLGQATQAPIRTQPLSQPMPTSDPKPKTQTTSPVPPTSTGSKPGKAFSLQETDILGMDLGATLGPSKMQSAGLDLDLGDFGVTMTTKPKDDDAGDILGGIHAGPAESISKASPMDDLKMQEMFGEIDPTARSLAAESKVREIQAEEDARRKIAQRKQIEEENQRRIDAKMSVAEELEPKIKGWAFASNGTPNNIRILLSTLHTVVWEECDWESITMGELMTDAQVRSQYRKAITKVHPDHNSHITDAGSLFLMDRLFNLLNKAYTETLFT